MTEVCLGHGTKIALTLRVAELEDRLIELQHAVQPLHHDYEMLKQFGPVHEDWERLAQIMGWSTSAHVHTKWSAIKAGRKVISDCQFTSGEPCPCGASPSSCPAYQHSGGLPAREEE